MFNCTTHQRNASYKSIILFKNATKFAAEDVGERMFSSLAAGGDVNWYRPSGG